MKRWRVKRCPWSCSVCVVSFCCSSEELTQCKSLQSLRITAEKASIITTASIFSPTTVGVFLAKESLSRFVQDKMLTQADAQPVFLPVAAEGFVLLSFCFLPWMSCLLDRDPCSLWAQELQFPAFWEIHTMLKKGAGRLSASYFFCFGGSSCSVGGRGAAPGRFYSSELCNPPLHWKLEGDSWGHSRQPFN